MSAQGEARHLLVSATTRRGHPARATRRRLLWRLTLFLFLLAALFALAASPALADGVQAEAYGWFKYSSGIVYNGGLPWYGYWGYLSDVDAGVADTQILIANSKPVDFIFFWAEQYNTGTFVNICCIYNKVAYGTLPASSTPRAVSVNGNIKILRVTGANAEERYLDAAKRFLAGYFVFYYHDGTSAIVYNGPVDDDPVLDASLGDAPDCNMEGDPVNTSTGNATYTSTDLSLPGQGLALTFTRTYNSQDADRSGFLGRGWRCEYQAALEFPSSTEVTCVAADGRRETFVSAGGGSYQSPSGVTERLYKNADGTYTLLHLDQSRLEFDSTGRLSTMLDRYGNSILLTYNSSGQLTGVSESGGRSLSFTYSYAYLVEVEDSAGRTVLFTYDHAGNLTGATDPNGHTTIYAYDAENQLLTVTKPEGTAPYITYAYVDGQATWQTDALGNELSLAYDQTEQETTVTDARDNTSLDSWDSQYRLVERQDPLGNSIFITYNSAGFPETVTDANGHETSFEYDTLGNLIAALDPLGHETEAGYDTATGNLLWLEDALDQLTTFTWDATGTFLDSVASPIGTTSFTWNPDGTLETVTDADSHVWSYDYNAYGDLVSGVDPLGYETSYEYDPAGRLTAIEDANSSRMEFSYDTKGNPTTIKDPLAETDPLNRHQLDFTFDDNDNLTQIEDARGNVTSLTYDELNRLSLVQDALSGEAAFTYDANHNLASLEDPNGHTTTFTYDACDRVSAITDALGEETAYEYDPVGNLAGISYPNGNETAFTYNDANLPSLASYATEATTWSFFYNPTNTVSTVEKNDGKTWAFTYDSGNRLTTASDENDAALGTFDVEWTYDDVSSVTGIDLDGVVSLALTYSARNLVTTLEDSGGTTSFAHDDGGRLTEIGTPEGSSRSLTYDPCGHLTEVENATGSGSQTFAYTYDASGNVLSENLATYTYDALNRLTGWYDPTADVTTTYAYDAAGNLTQVQEDGVTTESYSYNAGNEITNAGFSYDANGNLTADGTFTYLYDAQGQLREVTTSGTPICSMTYDYAGRRTSLTTAAGTTYFHWASGLLVAESDGTGTVTATYAYGPEGGLISMTRGGETYYYQTNARGDVVSITDDSGAVVNSYTYDPWGAPLSATETVVNPFRYAGYYYDPSSGLYYLWHRYYDPDLRRFLTQDLVFNSQYDTAALNPYVYVLDNPASLADPLGLSGVFILPSQASEEIASALADAVDFLVVGPAKELQRWLRWLGQYVPLTSDAECSLAWYQEKYAETGAWYYWLGAKLAGAWTPDTWAWTTIDLATFWRFGLGAGSSGVATSAICPVEAEETVRNAAFSAAQLADNYMSSGFHRIPAFLIDDISERGVAWTFLNGDFTLCTKVQLEAVVNGKKGVATWIVDSEGFLTEQHFLPYGH